MLKINTALYSNKESQMLFSFLRGSDMSNKSICYLGNDDVNRATQLITANPLKLRDIDTDVLTQNPCVVETAIAFNIRAATQIPREFSQKCPDVISKLITSYPEILRYLTLPVLYEHKKDILKIIKTRPQAISYLDDLYLTDHPDIVDKLLTDNGYNVAHLSSRVQISHPVYIEKMLKECPFAVQNLSPYFFRKYPDVITRVLKKHPGAAACIHPDYIDENPSWGEIALKLEPGFLSHVSETFVETHQTLVIRLIETNHCLLAKITKKQLFIDIAKILNIKVRLNKIQKQHGFIY